MLERIIVLRLCSPLVWAQHERQSLFTVPARLVYFPHTVSSRDLATAPVKLKYHLRAHTTLQQNPPTHPQITGGHALTLLVLCAVAIEALH